MIYNSTAFVRQNVAAHIALLLIICHPGSPLIGNGVVSAFLLPVGKNKGVASFRATRPSTRLEDNANENAARLEAPTTDRQNSAIDKENVKSSSAASLSTFKSSSISSRLLSNRESLEELYPNFPRTWVPLSSTGELDPNRPTPIAFLGQSYVTYYSSTTGKWVVVDDVCPHRLAPLSEGRIEPETGFLQCSYHGWSFDAANDGSCQHIPQALPKVEQAARQNERSCLTTYTTYVHAETGVLWIWPWKQDVLSFAKDEWRLPEGIMKSVVPSGINASTYSRDNPYGWDTLVENLIDPGHIPFAHHGLQGSRKDAIPINMTRPSDPKENGFSFEWADRTMGMMRHGQAEFRAPFLVNYQAVFEPKPGSKDTSPKPWQLAVLCVPTKPGWSRVMVLSFAPAMKQKEGDDKSLVDIEAPDKKETKTKKKKKPSLLAIIFKILPRWVVHLMNNKFFDSDMAFLHYQEQLRRPQNGASYKMRGDARYFMPAESDRSIAALHGWVGQYATSYIEQQATQLPHAIYDRSRLFDRWGQHTSHCKVCQDALAGIQKWKRNCQIILAGSVLLGFRHWAPRLLAVACLGVLKLLGNMEGAFYKGEFKHYENN